MFVSSFLRFHLFNQISFHLHRYDYPRLLRRIRRCLCSHLRGTPKTDVEVVPDTLLVRPLPFLNFKKSKRSNIPQIKVKKNNLPSVNEVLVFWCEFVSWQLRRIFLDHLSQLFERCSPHSVRIFTSRYFNH